MAQKALILLLAASFLSSFDPYPARPVSIDASQEEARWVDSLYASLTEAERIGQLLMVRAHSDLGPDHVAQVERLVRDHHVGGLCFFQGNPLEQGRLTNRYQDLAGDLPLLISMDAEWGLGMRLKTTTISYPRQLMLGAIQDNHLLYEMGAEIARQCRRLGVHLNFAPVADVNNNPQNPVINYRSFGEDRYNVAVKSYLYMKGMQDNGVIACGKHFPGHGDTDVDSHYDLPVIPHPFERLDSIELFPFQVLVEQGIGSVMVAHLAVPSLDPTPNLPTSLSEPTIAGLLKTRFQYGGLIITDGLGMKGVTKHFRPGETEALALAAGNDILLLPENVPAAVKAIQEYLAAGKISQARLEESVKKVLRAKYRLGLTRRQSVNLDNIEADLNHPNGIAVKRKLIEKSLTLVRNRGELIPFAFPDTIDMAALSLGASGITPFQQSLSRFARAELYQADKAPSASLLETLARKELVIVSLHRMSQTPKDNYGISPQTLAFLDELRKRTRVVAVVFGNPYALAQFESDAWLLEAYDEDPITQDLAAQGLFGVFGFEGRLPVTASATFPYQGGINSRSLFRLGFGIPEEMGMRSEWLAKIEPVALEAIDKGATPGCVVLVAREGRIVYQQAFGRHTYQRSSPALEADHVFDLASITKVAATTLAIMKLQEEKRIDIDQPLGTYMADLAGTGKDSILIRDILLHQAGFRPWIPFYLETVDEKGRPKPEFYRSESEANFTIPVAKDLFLIDSYRDTIWSRILASPLYDEKKYKYSDLGFYMLAELVRRVSGKSLDRYLAEKFFDPMGLKTAGFNPWERFAMQVIPPTEDDAYFRQEVVQGYVHDMGAAMLGGVSGNAGLFANAYDLAAIMQLLLNKGYYNGVQYLQPATVDQFTRRCSECTRRGLGFDMLQMDPKQDPNFSEEASETTFGHLGFTGTAVWVDPQNQLIYLFLSNRTFPDMNNNKLGSLNIRPRMQEIIYQSFMY